MERKIGEIFEYNGEWYQCVVAIQGCRGCSFRTHDYCTRHLECLSDTRSDETSVIFKKREKVGEFIEFARGLYFQRYQLVDSTAFYEGDTRLFFNVPTKTFVYIEIKTKEDMEENKLNLKPFDVQKAREGKPVCTRDGAKARIICFDAKSDAPIIALITTDDGTEITFDYLSDGTFFNSENHDNDLMMLPEKKEGWVKIRKDVNLYNTKEEADRKMIGNDEYVTAKVCWEE